MKSERSSFFTATEDKNYQYKAIITNHRLNLDISNNIEEIKFAIPNSSDKISSIKATFTLAEPGLIIEGDLITIKIININNTQHTLLKGKATITNITTLFNQTESINIEIVDELKFLFEKIVDKDVFLFDQYLYYSQQKENSILHILGKKLGFTNEQMIFDDIRDSQSRLIKVPFMLFRKGNRYIDELQTLLEATKGRVFINNLGNLIYKNGLFNHVENITCDFNSTNILSSLGRNFINTEKNGIKVTYDSYKYLDNQVIFDLSNKVEIKVGTTVENQKLEFNIKYITDLAIQHNITKAEGYYYVNKEAVRVQLQENTHYKLVEFKETSAKVKFFNPFNEILYIDKFEIKGIPLVKFEGNEVNIKSKKDMAENEENFASFNKNKYIQTDEFASEIARLEYIDKCKNKTEMSFKCNFMPSLIPGNICTFNLNNIKCKIKILTVSHSLSSGFFTEVVAEMYEHIEQEFHYDKVESITAKDSFLENLNNIKDKVDENKGNIEEIKKIEGARGFVSETDPSNDKEIKEPDVWFNPTTKEFKVWRNNQWNPAREEDIPPALMTALKAQAGVFRIGANDVSAGIFFQYDNDTNNPVFGTTDSEDLAEVSIDKKANVLIRNANNKIALNMKDPENPSLMNSKILMEVYDSNDAKHKDTTFQIGDETGSNYIQHKDGNLKLCGEAEITSYGSNETTVIRDGSISFTRNGENITTFRNMRAGSVVTDGTGRGYVDFTGMKQDLLILPSMKGFDVSANVRSLNCRAEKDPTHLAQNRYKFFVYGTEEIYEGKTTEVLKSKIYTKIAYSAGIESCKTKTSNSNASGFFLTTDDRTFFSNPGLHITRTKKTGIIAFKIYIDDQYYGETDMYIDHTTASLHLAQGRDRKYYIAFNKNSYNMPLSGYMKTTADKNKKIIRVEPYLKVKPIFSLEGRLWKTVPGGDFDKPDINHDKGMRYYDVTLSNLVDSNITFEEATYFFTPSSIQNIVGGGEVHYLAIEP